MSVAYVRSQRKHTSILSDMHVKHLCFLERREVPELGCARNKNTTTKGFVWSQTGKHVYLPAWAY